MAERRPKEAKFKTPTYHTWCSMKTRCTNKNNPKWDNYGGRGITLVERWNSYDNFLKDMGPSYKPGMTLDRIDNDGNYSPENCRWATLVEQGNNKRNNLVLEYGGLKLTLPQWGRVKGIKSSTIRQRYYGYKWSVEKCIETPVYQRTALGKG